MFLWLKLTVTPGLRSLLTPLASAAWLSFSSTAFFIASFASQMTCAGAIGAEDVRPEFEGIFRTLLGIGGGGGMLLRPAVPAAAKVAARRPWAGLPGSPIDAAAVGGRSIIVELIETALARGYRNHEDGGVVRKMARVYQTKLCGRREAVTAREKGVVYRYGVVVEVVGSEEQTELAVLNQLDESQ